MNASRINPRRRSGQLSAVGRGELPLWAVLVVASGVLALGIGGSSPLETEAAGAAALGPKLPASGGVDSQANGSGRPGKAYVELARVPLAGQDAAAMGGRSTRDQALAADARRGGPGPVESSAQVNEDRSLDRDDSLAVSGEGASASQVLAKAPMEGLREVGRFRGGVRHGHWKAWREDGTLLSEGNYVDGLRDGVWAHYSSTGALWTEVRFEAGIRSGEWTAYSSSGAILEEGQYANDTATGRWTKYYSGGQIKERGRFVNGLREGHWEFYDDLGLPTLQAGEYRAGIKIQ